MQLHCCLWLFVALVGWVSGVQAYIPAVSTNSSSAINVGLNVTDQSTINVKWFNGSVTHFVLSPRTRVITHHPRQVLHPASLVSIGGLEQHRIQQSQYMRSSSSFLPSEIVFHLQGVLLHFTEDLAASNETSTLDRRLQSSLTHDLSH
jgi:hypothetical protein